MSWFFEAINSSLGKKFIMAISGIFLLIFLVIHLFGNIFLYVSRDAFNQYVFILSESALSYIIKVIEVVLFLGLIVHAYQGIRLTLENFIARPNRYAVNPKEAQADLPSRTMWITASIVFIFLVIHLRSFWYVFKFGEPGKNITMYDIVIKTFQDPFYSLLYFICVLLLGFHLWHGFQSTFQSLGLNHKKYTPAIKFFGKLYTIIITGGFATFPVYFYFLGGK
ncbi:MAG: succinate dehydrogenase cytochrome b subunit [Ignavibacteriales bacterium]|nr:succinate dehydrogenase cytochrome b subunit [Ignavibacteriales bacterium]